MAVQHNPPRTGSGIVTPSCARLPAQSLPLLARLRAHPGVRLVPSASAPGGGQSDPLWLFWPPDDEQVASFVQPLLGAELFVERNGLWFRTEGGQVASLPSFEVPSADQDRTVSLLALLSPAPFQPERSGLPIWEPLPLKLVRDEHVRPATALLCPLMALERWAALATTRQLDALQAAWDRDRVLLRGSPLPPLFDTEAGPCVRYAGQQVLVPLGFRLDPPFFGEQADEAVVRSALGLQVDEVAVLDEAGMEVIPRSAFGPVTRAGVRLALWGTRP